MQKLLNKILCRFRKPHNTQHALFILRQACQKELDKSGNASNILMGLPKTYDCKPHDLHKAKLGAYGLDKISLTILFDYLNNHKQRTKIVCSFSSWYDIVTGIP